MISPRRLNLNANDQIVEAEDPASVRLLVAEGSEISDELARKHNLAEYLRAHPEAPEAKARGADEARAWPAPKPEKAEKGEKGDASAPASAGHPLGVATEKVKEPSPAPKKADDKGK